MFERGLRGRLLAAAAAAVLLASAAPAQRPFQLLDPFYQGESARRSFYDGFALAGEVAYRPAGPFQQGEGERPGPLALSLRLDYAPFNQLDLAAIFDVSGGLVGQLGGGPVRLSWLVAKPYWSTETTDYAVRIAVDPVSEGGLGFRQTDVAFLSSSNLSPLISSDFAIGLRQAHVGYERLQLDEGEPGVFGPAPLTEPVLVRTRAVGREFHVMWGHNLHFDPAGSNLFLALLGEAMDYDLVEMRPLEGAQRPGEAEEGTEGRFRGGSGWVRTGVEWSRPSYVFSPYASLPMVRWVEGVGTWGPRLDHARFGVRLTLR